MLENETQFLPRLVASQFRLACDVMPVVVLTGARQTGKSTFVQMAPAATGRAYRSLDARSVLDIAESDPEQFVGIHQRQRLTIDEVQRAPALLSAIKIAVDNEHQREAGHFVLTGSANLLLMRRVNETLAGRASYLALWPLTRREQLGLGRAGIWSELLNTPLDQWRQLVEDQSVPSEDWRALAQRGGYPRPATQLHEAAARAQWFTGYIDTYLERDIPELSDVGSIPDFRRFMQLAALKIGTLLNQSEMGRQTGLAQTTIRRYLNLLETSYQLVRIPAYAVSRKHRLMKAPKGYWSDVGLALALSGEREPTGACLENIVLHDLLAWRTSEIRHAEILYWRTTSGVEVDFVIETPQGMLAVEVKSGQHATTDAAAGIRTFINEHGDKVLGGLVLHGGTETFWLAERVLATPWWRVV